MRIILVPCLLALATLASADWQMDRFMVSIWGAPTDDATAKAYVDAGINTVMCPQDRLGLCRKHGLRAIVMDGTPELAAKLKDDPAVWGWYVRDEPPAEQFKVVAGPVAAFHKADPNHPAYVNLMAWMNLGQYLDTVKPRFLSYDYYQWWWGPKNHFGRLEAHRKAALQAGIPLICWVEANADPRWEWGKPGATYLPDNEPKLRQSVYTALAYGVKGIQWFVEPLIFARGEGNRPLPRLTKAGEDIKAIDAELATLGPTLLRLRSVAVYHTDPVPPGGQPVPPDCPLQIKGRHITLGLFAGGAGTSYALVVNNDITVPRRISLSPSPRCGTVWRFDRALHMWVALPARAARLTMRPGDGELLELQ